MLAPRRVPHEANKIGSRPLSASDPCNMEHQQMDENRIAGNARSLGGRAEEAAGRATGDLRTEAAGVANQVKGAAQDFYGRARDGAADLAESARGTGTSFERLLRHTIEDQPYTAVAIAVGIGWLLGRMHRPL